MLKSVEQKEWLFNKNCGDDGDVWGVAVGHGKELECWKEDDDERWLGQKRGESLMVAFTTPSSGLCPHNVEEVVTGEKKLGDSSSFRSSLLSSLHSSWLSVRSSFFFTSFIITRHSLIHSSIHSSNHPLYYPLIRFDVPTNPIKPKPKFQKAEKNWVGFNPLIRLEFW